MIPGPIIKKDKDGLYTDEEDKEYIMSYMIDSLSEIELEAKSMIFNILNKKHESEDRIIDMFNMVNYTEHTKYPLTENMCRRLINKYEYEFINDKFFIITNGKKSWQKYDEIRKARIQKG